MAPGRIAVKAALLASLVVGVASAAPGPSAVAAPEHSAGGESSRPAVSAVVLLHGFDSHGEIWRGSDRALRAQGFDPIVVTWEPEPGQLTPQAAVAVGHRIAAELAKRGHERFHLVGHSLGGVVARLLAERPGLDAEEARGDGSWRGDGVPDLDLAARVESLTLFATPNRGARTGAAGIACAGASNPRWRPLACDLIADAFVLRYLGNTASVPTLALAGVTPFPALPAPGWDGDGDGRARFHDGIVQAESALLAGAEHTLVRSPRGHRTLTCSGPLNEALLAFLGRPTSLPADACEGLSKAQWRAAQAP